MTYETLKRKIKGNLKLHNPVKHLKRFVKIDGLLKGVSRIAFICTTEPCITLKLKTTLVKVVYCIKEYNRIYSFHKGYMNNEVKHYVIIPLSDNCSYLNLFVYTHTRVQYF